MALDTVPTTVLEAVNEMLTAIGTVPVNTLDAPGSSDVAIAEDTLSGVNREVQSRGWWFNRLYAHPLAPSGNEITVPQDFIAVRPSRGLDGDNAEPRRFVARGQKLYRIDGTATFSETVYVDAVKLLPFDELPESMRRYITVRAARIFQTKVLGDEQLGVFTQLHEDEAWQILEADDAENSPVSNMYMQRVRRMGRLMRPDPGDVPERQERRRG